MSKFGRIIDCPLFPDVASENLAQERCKRLWSIVYHKEPYDMLSTFYKFNGSASASGQVCPVDDIDGLEELIAMVAKQTSFYHYVGSSGLLNILSPFFGFSPCRPSSVTLCKRRGQQQPCES